DWIVRPNTHEALIDRSVFERTQEIIAKGRRPRRPAGRSVGSPYLLSGLIVCTLCDSRVHGRRNVSGRKSNGKRCTTFSYVCGGYVRGGNIVCPSAAIPQAALESAICDTLEERVGRLADPGFQRELADHIEHIVNGELQGLPDKLEEIERTIRANDFKVRTFVEQVSPENVAMLDRALTEVRLENDSLSQEADDIRKRLACTAMAGMDPRRIVKSLGQRLRLFGRLFRHGTMEERRTFLRQLLHRIEIDPVTRKGQAFWYSLDDLAVRQPKDHLFGLIGATGFEPATSASRIRP
ncbi:MAG: recombinase zinc beta ribbon domain-containing protein, partial [Planctomycetes bacterium]|nr:recombinase zinc beta ribbon domain-containing protein [Planctomycetota bacterium]